MTKFSQCVVKSIHHTKRSAQCLLIDHFIYHWVTTAGLRQPPPSSSSTVSQNHLMSTFTPSYHGLRSPSSARVTSLKGDKDTDQDLDQDLGPGPHVQPISRVGDPWVLTAVVNPGTITWLIRLRGDFLVHHALHKSM